MKKLQTIITAMAINLLPLNSIKADPVESQEGTYMSFRRSRINGQMDLLNIARNDCIEDLWIFTSGRWYDVGFNESEDGVSLDTNKAEVILSTTSGPVYEYHTHPHNYCPYPDVDGISLESVSSSDVLAHVFLAERAKAHGRMLFSKIVDEHGIWSYTVTRQLYDDILHNNVQPVMEMIESITEGSNSLLNVLPVNFDFKLNNYIEEQRNQGVIISYRRFR